MNELLKKQSISEFTKKEFSTFLEEIISAKGGEKYQDKLINHFANLVEHPDGTDLIFWVPDNEATPDAIIKKIEKWHSDNNLPKFKD